jgi:predicted nuclease of predicted toxin-antitoxin system
VAPIGFLADENCDFIVVRSLRQAGYDVCSIAEVFPSASDAQVLQLAIDEKRTLITEDKDFGEWVFSHGKKLEGVILIRFPGNARSSLSEKIKILVDGHRHELKNSFVVLEPGRARIRKI